MKDIAEGVCFRWVDVPTVSARSVAVLMPSMPDVTMPFKIGIRNT